MAHLPKDQLNALLKDLETELNRIRSWDGIKEKSPYIFYYKSIPFLHFHFKDGERSADVKDSKKSWGKPIQIPETKIARQKFIKEVLKRYNGVIK